MCVLCVCVHLCNVCMCVQVCTVCMCVQSCTGCMCAYVCTVCIGCVLCCAFVLFMHNDVMHSNVMAMMTGVSKCTSRDVDMSCSIYTFSVLYIE